MSNAVATESDKPGASLNWRQRKKAVARRKALVDGYVAALGGSSRVTAVEMENISRAVDLLMLAEQARAQALRDGPGGAGKMSAMVRLQSAAERAVRALRLPAPGSAAPPAQAWQDFLASQQYAAATKEDG